MNRFELHVDQSGLDENRQFVFFVMNKMLEEIQTLHHSLWGRRHECSIAVSAAANPIL